MTYEEEAHWWKTHDSADYPDEFKQVEMKAIFSALKISEKLRELSSELADRKGVGVATLVRMWGREKLRTEGHQLSAV